MTWKIRGGLTLLAALLGVCGMTAASAADLAPALTSEPMPPAVTPGWSFDVTFYGWATGLRGTVGAVPPLPSANIDIKFSDVLKHLDGAFMASGQAHYGRFVVLGDILYSKVSGSADLHGVLFSRATLDTSSFIGTVAVGYRLIDDPTFSVDAVAGIRGYAVQTNVHASGALLGFRQIDNHENWVDGLAGGQVKFALPHDFFVTGIGLVGGGSSKVAWDVFGGVGYRFNERTSAMIGYRASGVDYKTDKFVYDVVQQGPIVGMVMHF